MRTYMSAYLSGTNLSAILGHLGAFSGALVGQSWAHLSIIWVPSWGHLGAILMPIFPAKTDFGEPLLQFC